MTSAQTMQWLAGLAMCTTFSALAQPTETRQTLAPCADTLIISSDAYNVAPAHGNAGSIDWLHCQGSDLSVSLGAASFAIAGSRWQVAKVGAVFRTDPRWIGYLGATAGAGRDAGGSFNYNTVTDGVYVKAGEGVFLQLEHQFFDVAHAHANVLRVGVNFPTSSTIRADINVARSMDGNFEVRLLTARLDWTTPRARPFVGVSTGRQFSKIYDVAVGLSQRPSSNSKNGFAGVAIPLSSVELVLAGDRQETSGARRSTVSLALKIPFK